MPATMIGPKSSGRSAASEHHRPAGLAVADHARLALGLRVAGDHRFEEYRLGAAMSRMVWPGIGSGRKPMK